jgi:CHASE2 domain-containing sensor protein
MLSWRYLRIVFGVTAALAVWICREQGLLSSLEARTYRWSTSVARSLSPHPSPLLLVEFAPEQVRSDEAEILPQLLKVLEELGAQAVVFDFLPHHVTAGFYHDAVRYTNVFFGRELVSVREEPGLLTLAPLPTAATGLPLQLGIVHLPPVTRGIHSRQFREFQLDGQRHPALEMVVAARYGAGALPMAGDTYLVDFRGGPGSLPRIEAQRILAGEGVPELIAQRIVLVGIGTYGRSPGLYTPTTRGQQSMSPLEYQGHALATLLTGRATREVGSGAAFLIFLLVASGSLFVYDWHRVPSLVWRALIPFVVCIAIATLITWTLHLWLPVAGMILVQLLAALLGFTHRAIATNRALDTIVFSLSSALRDRLRTAGALAPDSWSHAVSMLQQTLDLTRMVFLDRIEGQYHVREVYAFNCSLADIDERRRDYRRTPYSTALEMREPIHLAHEKRPYLKNAQPGEEQYLVPLIFENHMYGFWAFSIDRARAAAIPNFVSVIRAYAEQVGKLLFLRQQETGEQAGTVWRQRLLKGRQREESYKALDTIVNRLEGRLTQLETLLRDLHTATMVYDLFGRPLEINVRMQELLKAETLVLQDLTIVEVIAKLTHKDVDSARHVLRKIIIDGHEVSLPVTLSGGRDHYVLNIRPLRLREGRDLRDEPTPFGVSGVVCELVDRTSLMRRHELKTEVIDRIAMQLRNDLAAIEFSSSLLQDGHLLEANRALVFETLRTKMQQAIDLIGECQHYLTNDVYRETVDRFPVNVQDALATVLGALQPLAEERGLKLAVSQPQLMSAVFAAPAKIEQVLSALLTVMLRDAIDQTTVRIEAIENDTEVVYHFSNVGFGLPNERFQEYLSGQEHLVAEDLKGLREAIQWVKEWDGFLDADSHIGTGIRATLRLRRFL